MLKHHGDALRRSPHRSAADQKLAGADVGEARDAAQQRRLAAAAGADDAKRLAIAHLQVELAECRNGAVEKVLAGVLGDDDGRVALPVRLAVGWAWGGHAVPGVSSAAQ